MKDELDRTLDDALASYSAQAPRVGLAGRVMARVRSDGDVSRRMWFSLGVAAAVVACAAIAMVVWRSESHRVPVADPALRTIVKKMDQPPVALPSPEPHRAVARSFARRAAHPQHVSGLPQREHFPTPDPLTPEERALVAFVQHAPEVARQLAQPDKPLEIEAINIRPIEIDGLEIGEIR